MVIYFIQCGKNGPIKIGKTSRKLSIRLSNMQTDCPYKLKCIWLYRGDEYTEETIHKKFKSEHIRGEWFHPSKQLLQFIEDNLSNTFEIKTPNGRNIYFIERMSGQDYVCYSGNKTVRFYHDKVKV